MFDFMMTDSCGFSNTGWMMPGLLMQPTNYSGSAAVAWTPPLMPSVSGYFGKAILYPNTTGYSSITPPTTIPINFQQSITFFTYFWVYSSAAPLFMDMVEFGTSNTGLLNNYLPAVKFLIYGGGLYFQFSKFITHSVLIIINV